MKKQVIRIFKFLSKPLPLVVINAFLIFIAVVLNFYFQAFCIPSLWASVAICICFVTTIVFPILKNRNALIMASFIQGFSIFIFLYIMIFFEWMNIYGLYLLILGLGIVIFIPHYLTFGLAIIIDFALFIFLCPPPLPLPFSPLLFSPLPFSPPHLFSVLSFLPEAQLIF
jgi:hypothetical protein